MVFFNEERMFAPFEILGIFRVAIDCCRQRHILSTNDQKTPSYTQIYK